MYACKQVNEQITGYASTVVVIVSPSEKTNGVVFSLRSVAQEALPVHRVVLSIRGNRILPCTVGTMTIVPCLHEHQLANNTRCINLACLFGNDRRAPLAAHLEYLTGFLLCIDNCLPFFEFVYHRLLAVHVLALIHGVDRD